MFPYGNVARYITCSRTGTQQAIHQDMAAKVNNVKFIFATAVVH